MLPDVESTTPPSHHSLIHHLPVGSFTDPRRARETVEVRGEPLASIVRVSVTENARGAHVPITEHLTLLHVAGPQPYLVHDVVERRGRGRPSKFGAVHHYATWDVMSTLHPSLARRALEISRDRALGVRIRWPLSELESDQELRGASQE